MRRTPQPSPAQTQHRCAPGPRKRRQTRRRRGRLPPPQRRRRAATESRTRRWRHQPGGGRSKPTAARGDPGQRPYGGAKTPQTRQRSQHRSESTWSLEQPMRIRTRWLRHEAPEPGLRHQRMTRQSPVRPRRRWLTCCQPTKRIPVGQPACLPERCQPGPQTERTQSVDCWRAPRADRQAAGATRIA